MVFNELNELMVFPKDFNREIFYTLAEGRIITDKVAGSLQYQEAAHQFGLSTASTGNDTDSKYNYALQKLNPKSGINSGVWSP
jgi:hypothetical protein